MKKFIYLRHLLVILLIAGLAACEGLFKDDEKESEPQYLVEYELVRSFLPGIIEAALNEIIPFVPEIEDLRDRVEHGVAVYRVSYRTTYEGEPIIASGLVSAPLGEGSFPLLSYQNGTNTRHSNAPSVNPEYDLYSILQMVSSTGFIVAIPDYLGFGATDNMFHPYLHADATVPVVIDLLRATEELGELRGHRTNNDLYLTGYSMGGWATMHVQKEIEARHSAEFDLKASAPSAGPYDLNFVFNQILNMETYPRPYFLGSIFNSYSNMDEISTPLNDIFNSPYDSLTMTLFSGSLSGQEINDYYTTNISGLFTEDYLANRTTDPRFASVSAALTGNSVDAWNVSTPTQIIHSTGDELVPFDVSNKLHQELLEAGTDPNIVQLVAIPDHTHTDGIIPAGLVALRWFIELTED